MKTIKTIIFNNWTLTILSAIAISIVIYFAGPLISIAEWTPLASKSSRWVTIFFTLTIWLTIKLFKIIKSRNEESGFLDNLFVKNASHNEDITKNERDTLELKFKEAFSSLKKASKNIGQKFNLYEMPWYIIIGPPGSGKTTALLNSGLKFPLSKEFGAGSVQGIGGTRNCDWWFTDKGIIIDTAGRYTTQDSHKEVDSSAWLDFLQLIKKFRKRCPINGVFVTISLQELLLQTTDQRAKHVAAISNRLQELKDVFKIEFPVYVLITKSDLISGFEEYFDNFSKTEREQVWGITFPYEKGQSTATQLASFSAEYDQLLKVLNERSIPRLHQERDQQRAQKIGSFPKQLQSVKPLVELFLVDVFENSRYSQQLMLRGCYFCSGTQEGTPIDRLMNKLSGPNSLPTSQGKGKSFFIKNLFENIVFKESGLVGTDIKFEKKLKLYNTAAIAAITLASSLLLASWGVSYSNNLKLIDQASSKLASLEELIKGLSPSELNPSKILPILNAARALPSGYDEQDSSASSMFGLGLSQSEKISDATISTYQGTLNKILLSRLMVDTEDKLANDQTDKNYTYAALRTYLMLGSEEHFRGEEVSTFYRISWLQSAAADLTSKEYDTLSDHINVLFENRPTPLPIILDSQLIEQSQNKLTNTPLDQTVFSRLQQVDLKGVSPFTIFDNAGQQLAETVFVRKSGLSLAEGIEGLYTKKAYDIILNEEIEKATDEVIQESWVYGDNYKHNRTIDKPSLVKAVKTLYRNSYINKYKNLLNDIDIAPFTNYDDAANALHILSGQSAPSPLQQLLEAIKAETELGVNAYEDNLADNSKFQQAKDKLNRMLGTSVENLPESVTKHSDPITAAFSDLHKLITPETEGGTIPLRHVLAQFSELYAFMNKVSVSSRDGALAPSMVKDGEIKLQNTRQVAKAQPSLFISPYMSSVADRTGTLALGGVMIHMNQQWAQEPYELCVNAVRDNYPFVKGSESEITLSDFGQVFGYNGVLDSFFSKNLKQYIDTSKSPWRVHSSHQQLISISSEALAAFEKAHYIRKSFFKDGSKQVSTTFKVEPRQMDSGLRGFYLNLDGQTVSYEFGPLLPDHLTWPGPNPGSGTDMTLKQVDGNDITIYENGDWAWFRLLDKVQVRRISGNSKYKINFRASGYSALYSLTAGAAYNPYRLGSRIQFTCPAAI
tara:strand:- start:11630 stop:15169 length:3540 start_codon:yes stop_codon:yes gene_type:complete